METRTWVGGRGSTYTHDMVLQYMSSLVECGFTAVHFYITLYVLNICHIHYCNKYTIENNNKGGKDNSSGQDS